MQGQGERIYLTNREGLTEYDIRPDYWTGRSRGLSAMVRVKDEAEWVEHSLNSIVAWCDEVAIFLQGTQSDGTDTIVAAWAARHPDKAVVYHYPFESMPNGPGHQRQAHGSVHERAYFYNWCQAKTRFTHAMKWDGDMVALDGLGVQVRELMRLHECVNFRGVDIAGYDLVHKSVKPYTACEPRVWRVSKRSWYYSGFKCEYFTYSHHDGFHMPDDAYLHFKWAKRRASARKDWPVDWQKSSHFVRINRRAAFGAEYLGPWPSGLEQEREKRRRVK